MHKRNWFYIIAGILIAGIAVWYFLNRSLNTDDVKNFITEQLPENIELKYDRLNTNLFTGKFSLENAEVIIKNKGIRITADRLKIKGIDYDNLLSTDTIAIKETQIENAFVWIDRSKLDTTTFSSRPKRRNIILKLDKFNVGFKGLEVKDTNGRIEARMNETQIGLNDLFIQSKPKKGSNQLEYALVKIKTDSLVLPLSSTQHLAIGAMELDSAMFKLKNTHLTLQDKGIQVNFDLLVLRGDDFNQILNKDTINFDECILTKGKIKINNASSQTQSTKDSLAAANKVIKIKEFRIADTNFEFIDRQGKPQFKFDHTNAFFTDLKIKTAPSADENSITYNFIRLNSRNLTYPMNHLHTLTVDEIKVEKNIANLNQLAIRPNFSRSEFQKQIKEEQDVINLTVPSLVVSDYDFSFDEANNFFAASNIALNNANLNIYRDKTKPDQTPRKPLYSEMLRKLKFRLNVNQVSLNNAKITYEEKASVSNPAGKIFFTGFNGTVKNIFNKNPSNDQVKISVDAQFMGHAPTHIDWNFNIHQPADHFTIAGTVNQLDAKSLDGFLVPNMKARLDGNVKKASFNFSGNDRKSSGRMDLLYDDLKVDVLDHKNEKKGFVSTIANFLVKNKKDRNDEVNNLISVERDQRKSFFNLFWLSLKEGIKQNVLKFQGRKDKIK